MPYDRQLCKPDGSRWLNTDMHLPRNVTAGCSNGACIWGLYPQDVPSLSWPACCCSSLGSCSSLGASLRCQRVSGQEKSGQAASQRGARWQTLAETKLFKLSLYGAAARPAHTPPVRSLSRPEKQLWAEWVGVFKGESRLAIRSPLSATWTHNHSLRCIGNLCKSWCWLHVKPPCNHK